MPTFHTEHLGRKSIAGDDLCTVILTDDEGVVRGGDHHWVRPRFAQRLEKLYASAPQMHGITSSSLSDTYRAIFNEELFDTDEVWANELNNHHGYCPIFNDAGAFCMCWQDDADPDTGTAPRPLQAATAVVKQITETVVRWRWDMLWSLAKTDGSFAELEDGLNDKCVDWLGAQFPDLEDEHVDMAAAFEMAFWLARLGYPLTFVQTVVHGSRVCDRAEAALAAGWGLAHRDDNLIRTSWHTPEPTHFSERT